MSQSLSKVLLHIVFSTAQRRPFLLDQDLRREAHQYFGGILLNLDCQPVVIGGVEDHVHILAALSRSHSISEVVKEVKRSSSIWIKTMATDLSDFAWQNGYGAFSIGFSQVAAVREYISDQQEHHKRVSFQDEYRAFLKRYEIAYNENYLWD